VPTSVATGTREQAASRERQTASAVQPLPAAPVAESAGLQFIQDNRENMNVRIDLGSVVPAGREVTLIFEYEGRTRIGPGRAAIKREACPRQ
jgi:hypothetical protein